MTPSCPRCGYDQSGEVARWESECPLDGRCTECGLEYQWRQVMRPGMAVPRWSFEHAPWPALLQLIASAAMTWLPGSLWRRLKMDHPVVSRRLLILFILSLVLAHLGAAGMAWWERNALNAYFAIYSSGRAPEYKAELVGAVLNPYGKTPWFEPVAPRARGVWWALSAALVMPLTPLLMPWTLRRLRVKPGHVLRMACYWLLTLPILWTFALFSLSFAQFGRRQLMGAASVGQYLSSMDWRWLEDFSRFVHRSPWRLPIAVAAWAAIWWFAAFRRYLKLPRPWLDAILLSILSLGAGLLIAMFWPGNELLGEIGRALRLS